MTVSTDAIRVLHRIHQQLADVRERLERGPKQIKARQANVTRLETEHEAAREQTKQAKVQSDQKQLSLKSGESKIVDLKGKLNTCASNKEYQALQDQIAAAEMANSVLEDEILESFERITTLETGVQEAEKKQASAQADLQALEAKFNEEKTRLESEIERLEGELRAAEADLPADFKVDYERVVRARGADALAKVEQGTCGGCYKQILPNQLAQLAMSQAVFCKSCGRLLYLPEDTFPG